LRAHLPAAPDTELSLHIQAVIGADLGAPWVGKLYAAAPAAVRPVKWQHVRHFVTEGIGSEPQIVRDGLQAQTVVLTDAHEMARSVDLSVSLMGTRIPIATMLLMRKWCGVPATELERHYRKFREWLLRDMLERSGVGILNSLTNQAMSFELDTMAVDRNLRLDLSSEMMEEFGRKVGRISKLACQATALTARYLDPQNRGYSDHRLMAAERFSEDLPWFDAQDRLRELAEQQIAFDRDDTVITAAVERLRRVAYAAADLWGQELDRGSVRAVDDADYIRVQLADVVCGWARTLVYQHGLVELVRRFRLVLYNGAPITLERAGRLDGQRREHREMLNAAAACGWTA
jgi:hypothetical protein